MTNLYCKISDNLPSIGGASGAIVDVTVRHNIFNSLSEFLVYIGYCIIGALVGYCVKSVLDICDADKQIKFLKDKIHQFDKKKERQEKASKYHEKLKLMEKDYDDLEQ
jgi:hypothetical protein